jgi:hypothetical protein
MPFQPISIYNDIGKKIFYIFHFFVLFKKNKNANIFLWYQVLTITLSRRCRSAMTRWIPMTSAKESGR